MSDLKCGTCERELSVTWTDTHGVAVCTTCGTPYRIYHYDEAGKREDKVPEPMLNEAGMALAKQYWGERKRRVFPASFDMGMERNGRTYSGASRDDCAEWNEWYEKQPHPPIEAGHGD